MEIETHCIVVNLVDIKFNVRANMQGHSISFPNSSGDRIVEKVYPAGTLLRVIGKPESNVNFGLRTNYRLVPVSEDLGLEIVSVQKNSIALASEAERLLYE